MKPIRFLSLALASVVVAVGGAAAPASAARPVNHGFLDVSGVGATWITATDESGTVRPMHHASIYFAVDPLRSGRGWIDNYGYASGKIVTTVVWMDAKGQPVLTQADVVRPLWQRMAGADVSVQWLPDSVAKVRVTAVMYAWIQHGWVQTDTMTTPDLGVPAPATWYQYGDEGGSGGTALFTYTDSD